MLFRKAILDRIRAGTVTLAFRRWKRPTVREGGTLRTVAGVLAIDRIDPVAFSAITDIDARQAGFAGRDDLLRDLGSRDDATLYRIAFHRAGDDPRERLRGETELGEAEVARLVRALADLDRRSRTQAWTRAALQLIAARAGITAGEIAERLDMDKAGLKDRVRKLKELGLTESLPAGYRISPRGKALLERLPRAE